MNTACANPISLRTALDSSSRTCALRRLSVIVPCHNEADSLPGLAAGLERLTKALAEQYEVEVVLVDDGSTDNTWELLQRFNDIFGGQAVLRLTRHEINRGLAAAISTGLSKAHADIVASLDADCTYDPLQLVTMLKLMGTNVDM